MKSDDPDDHEKTRKPYTTPRLVRYGGLTQPVLGSQFGTMADGKIVKGSEGKT